MKKSIFATILILVGALAAENVSAQSYRPFRHSDVVVQGQADMSKQYNASSEPMSNGMQSTSSMRGYGTTRRTEQSGFGSMGGLQYGDATGMSAGVRGMGMQQMDEYDNLNVGAGEAYSFAEDVASVSSRPRRTEYSGDTAPENPSEGDTWTYKGETYTYHAEEGWVDSYGTKKTDLPTSGDAPGPIGEPYVMLLFALAAVGVTIVRKKRVIANE